MKEMLNWDLYTHPEAREFSKRTSNEEKIKLAQDWKNFMEKENMYISFYEWRRTTILKKANSWKLIPQKANPICYPVNTLLFLI